MDEQRSSSKQEFRRRWRMTVFASLAAISLGAGLMVATHQSRAAPTLTKNLATAADARSQFGFAALVAKVKPAVISVRVKLDQDVTPSSDDSDDGLPFPPGSPMDKFFRQFGLPTLPEDQSQGRPIVTGEGSGFFISADGYAVTNNHVVNHADSVEVTTNDGATYPAKLVGTDKKTDLALVKVNAPVQFPFVTFADERPRTGDWVVVVGNPFGLSETVTAGIVSA